MIRHQNALVMFLDSMRGIHPLNVCHFLIFSGGEFLRYKAHLLQNTSVAMERLKSEAKPRRWPSVLSLFCADALSLLHIIFSLFSFPYNNSSLYKNTKNGCMSNTKPLCLKHIFSPQYHRKPTNFHHNSNIHPRQERNDQVIYSHMVFLPFQHQRNTPPYPHCRSLNGTKLMSHLFKWLELTIMHDQS